MWLSLFESEGGSGLALRDQVCAALRRAMRSGALSLGERLPSTRVLARDLSLSRVTVEAAYGQLAIEGYLRRNVGKGSFVAIDLGVGAQSPIAPPHRSPGASTPFSQRGRRLLETGGCMEPMRLQAFAAGSPDLRAFPVALWRRVLNRRLRLDAEQLMRYGDPQGRPDLRAAISGYLAHSRGVRCHPGQVLVLTSSQQCLQLLAQMLLDDGDVVWMEDPGYGGARVVFAAAGARVVNLPVDAEGARHDDTMPTPRLIYLTPAHQFPTGQTLSLERRRRLIAYARRTGAYLVEDDYDSEFQYDARAMPALQSLDEEGRVIYIGSFSKTLFPSLRLAYTVLPEDMVQPLLVARSAFDGHSSQLMQAVTADFIAQGHFAAHLRLMRQLYRSRRDCLLDALHTNLPWAQPLHSAGGLQLSVRLPEGSEADLTRRAARLGIATPSLSALHHEAAKVDGWRLGFAALRPEEITAAIKSLATLRQL